MPASDPVLAVGLPVAERRRSADFYRAFLEREPFGTLAGDGLPEPLQFRVDAGTTILLVPSSGFNWVLQDHRAVGPPSAVRMALTWIVGDESSVRRTVSRAEEAGAETVVPPAAQPWQVFAGVVSDPDGHLWVVQDRAM